MTLCPPRSHISRSDVCYGSEEYFDEKSALPEAKTMSVVPGGIVCCTSSALYPTTKTSRINPRQYARHPNLKPQRRHANRTPHHPPRSLVFPLQASSTAPIQMSFFPSSPLPGVTAPELANSQLPSLLLLDLSFPLSSIAPLIFLLTSSKLALLVMALILFNPSLWLLLRLRLLLGGLVAKIPILARLCKDSLRGRWP